MQGFMVRGTRPLRPPSPLIPGCQYLGWWVAADIRQIEVSLGRSHDIAKHASTTVLLRRAQNGSASVGGPVCAQFRPLGALAEPLASGPRCVQFPADGLLGPGPGPQLV